MPSVTSHWLALPPSKAQSKEIHFSSHYALPTISVKIRGHIMFEEFYLSVEKHSCLYHTLNHCQDLPSLFSVACM